MRNGGPKLGATTPLWVLLSSFVLLCGCACDEGSFTIHSMAVKPYNITTQQISSELQEHITFYITTEHTKHPNEFPRLDLIPRANATPPCRGYVNKVRLKAFSVHTNKPCYYRAVEPRAIDAIQPEANYLLPVPAGTNLYNFRNQGSSFFRFTSTIPDARDPDGSQQLLTEWYPLGIGANYFGFDDADLHFPQGDYTFWFEWEFWDGSVFRDSCDLTLELKPINQPASVFFDERTEATDVGKRVLLEATTSNHEHLQIEQQYNLDGTLHSKRLLVDSVQEGSAVWYFPNGNVQELAVYKTGQQIAVPHATCYPNGAVKTETIKNKCPVEPYKGQQCAEKIAYDTTGVVTLRQFYNIGSLNKGALLHEIVPD